MALRAWGRWGPAPPVLSSILLLFGGVVLPIAASAAVCGNGILERGEQCDDGNTVPSDCCSERCVAATDASPCDDGLRCTQIDVCRAARCVGTGNPCDDGVGCTDDACSETDGPLCSSVPVDAVCDDGLYCNGSESCVPGVGCREGTPPSLDCVYLNQPCMVAGCDETARACRIRENREDPACGYGEPARGETPGRLPLGFRWIDDPSTGPIAKRGALRATLEAFASERVEASISVVAAGLDQRSAERVVKKRVRVSPRRAKTVRLRLAKLPVQSIGSPTGVELHATIARPDGTTLVVPSSPIYVTFDDERYRSAVVRTAADAFPGFSREAGQDYGAFVAEWQAMFASLFSQQGRVLHEGRMVDVAEAARTDYETDGWKHAGSLPAQQRLPEAGSLLGLLETFAPLDVGVSPRDVTVCANWRALFVDAGFGEDHLAGKDVMLVPARYALATITTGTRRFGTSVYLDADGCTRVELDPGQYALWVWPHMKKDETRIYGDYRRYTPGRCKFCNDGECIETAEPCEVPAECDDVPAGLPPGLPSRFCSVHSQPTYKNVFVAGFTIGLPMSILPPNPNLTILAHDPLTRTSAVVSQVLATEDNALLASTNLFTTHFVHADDETCKSLTYPSSACATGIDLYLSSEGNPPVHDTHWKFVVAHEFGHNVEDMLFGLPSPDYGLTLTPSAECRCDHVVSSNQVHCLQSLETGSAAQKEGWAQFYAAKIMNDPAEGDCSFVYYKEFLQPPATVLAVPNVHDCRNPARWWRSNCYYAPSSHSGYDLGTELDWLVFLWNANTVGSYATAMPDLGEIYRMACGTPSSPHDCKSDDDARVIELEAGAVSLYGLDAPLSFYADHFLDSADQSGVEQ